MKGYIFFLLLVICSFAAAKENVVGYVRIKNNQPARYNVPNSGDTLLKIKYVYHDDKRPQFVVLVPVDESRIDALVVNFDRFKEKGLVSKRFKNALEPGFLIDISAKDLVFDSSQFLSVLKVDANNINSLTQRGKYTAIKECSRKNTQGWNVWTSDIQLTDDCL
jgi:hypothetical protein